MEFNYAIKDESHYAIVHLSGNLITEDQTKVIVDDINKMIEKNLHNFIINLSQVNYMNSTGLNLLIKILTKSRNSGGETIVTEVPDRINKLFLISKLNNVFSVTNNLEAAINILNKEKTCL